MLQDNEGAKTFEVTNMSLNSKNNYTVVGELFLIKLICGPDPYLYGSFPKKNIVKNQQTNNFSQK